MADLTGSGLTKSFGGAAAIQNVSVRAGAGDVLGILGPNGAGKTTTLLTLAGWLKPETGEVSLDGIPSNDWTAQQWGRIGFAPQRPTLYPELTARQNLAFFARISPGKRSREGLVEGVLEEADLLEVADQTAATLSGGMQQRLSIAIALVKAPDVLLLDEPTAEMDPIYRDVFLESIRKRVRRGTTVIIASNALEDVASICSQIIVLQRGVMVASSYLETLKARAGTRITLVLDGDHPDLEGMLGDQAVLERKGGRTTLLFVIEAESDPHSRLKTLSEISRQVQALGLAVSRLECQQSDLRQTITELFRNAGPNLG